MPQRYLQARGYSQSILDEFGIGFEPRSNALMAGRICFPIHNIKGQLVAYAGRFIPSRTDDNGKDVLIDAKGREQPRYKLPSGFRKQLELYNLHRVLERNPDTDTIVLVEGFWSVLRLHSFTVNPNSHPPTIGDSNSNKKSHSTNGLPTAALMGRSVSSAQIQLLKTCGFSKIILMLDGDEEGRAATQEAILKLAPHFFVRDAYLPDGVKPDNVDEEFLRKLANELSGCKSHFRTQLAAEIGQPSAKEDVANVEVDADKPTSQVEQAEQSKMFPTIGMSLTTTWKQ